MNVRSILLAWASVSLLACGAVHGQNSECQNVQFSAELLSRYPSAPEACLDVISRNGQEFAVFRVRLDRVRGNTLHVRFNNPDGSRGPVTRITAQPDFRVLVDGRAIRVRDLAANQELTAYVRVDRPVMALAPATQTTAWQVVPLTFVAVDRRTQDQDPADETGQTPLASAQDEPVMPETAGHGPLLASASLLFLLCAAGVKAVRSMRSARHKRIARLW